MENGNVATSNVFSSCEFKNVPERSAATPLAPAPPLDCWALRLPRPPPRASGPSTCTYLTSLAKAPDEVTDCKTSIIDPVTPTLGCLPLRANLAVAPAPEGRRDSRALRTETLDAGTLPGAGTLCARDSADHLLHRSSGSSVHDGQAPIWSNTSTEECAAVRTSEDSIQETYPGVPAPGKQTADTAPTGEGIEDAQGTTDTCGAARSAASEDAGAPIDQGWGNGWLSDATPSTLNVPSERQQALKLEHSTWESSMPPAQHPAAAAQASAGDFSKSLSASRQDHASCSPSSGPQSAGTAVRIQEDDVQDPASSDACNAIEVETIGEGWDIEDLPDAPPPTIASPADDELSPEAHQRTWATSAPAQGLQWGQDEAEMRPAVAQVTSIDRLTPSREELPPSQVFDLITHTSTWEGAQACGSLGAAGQDSKPKGFFDDEVAVAKAAREAASSGSLDCQTAPENVFAPAAPEHSEVQESWGVWVGSRCASAMQLSTGTTPPAAAESCSFFAQFEPANPAASTDAGIGLEGPSSVCDTVRAPATPTVEQQAPSFFDSSREEHLSYGGPQAPITQPAWEAAADDRSSQMAHCAQPSTGPSLSSGPSLFSGPRREYEQQAPAELQMQHSYKAYSYCPFAQRAEDGLSLHAQREFAQNADAQTAPQGGSAQSAAAFGSSFGEQGQTHSCGDVTQTLSENHQEVADGQAESYWWPDWRCWVSGCHQFWHDEAAGEWVAIDWQGQEDSMMEGDTTGSSDGDETAGHVAVQHCTEDQGEVPTPCHSEQVHDTACQRYQQPQGTYLLQPQDHGARATAGATGQLAAPAQASPAAGAPAPHVQCAPSPQMPQLSACSYLQYASHLAQAGSIQDAIECAQAAVSMLQEKADQVSVDTGATQAPTTDWRTQLQALSEATGASVARSGQAVASRVGAVWDRTLTGLLGQKKDNCVV